MDDKDKKLIEKLKELRNGLDDLDIETTKMMLDADKLDRALQLQHDREEYYKLKGKDYTTPRTYAEAEGELPSMEWLATGFAEKKWGDYRTKTKEEILTKGTLLEKLRLFFSSADLSNYFDGMDSTLSLKEMEIVRDSIKTEKDSILTKKCTAEYYTIAEYGRLLSNYYKRYQAIFGKLAVLLCKWDEYESRVATYNEIQESILGADYSAKPRPELQREHDLNALATKVLLLTKLDGAKIKQREGSDLSFYLYVDGRGGLYAQIRRAAKEVRGALSDFKAYAKAAEEYIENSTLQYTPISILMATENAECERYERYLVQNPIYYRSELVYRPEGVTITPEEEKRAVIPFYFEVRPTAKIYKDCKTGIKQIEEERY